MVGRRCVVVFKPNEMCTRVFSDGTDGVTVEKKQDCMESTCPTSRKYRPSNASTSSSSSSGYVPVNQVVRQESRNSDKSKACQNK